MYRVVTIIIVSLLISISSLSQVLILESTKACLVKVDGQIMDSLQPGEYLKIESFTGDHVISAEAYLGIYSFKTKIKLDENQKALNIADWKLHRNKLLNEIVVKKNEQVSYRPKEDKIGLLNEFGEKEKYMTDQVFRNEITLVSDQLFTSPQGETLVAVKYKKNPYYVKMNDLYFEIAHEK